MKNKKTSNMLKTIITAAVAAIACGFSAIAEDTVPTDVYDITMSAKVPYLVNGVRSYTTQKLKGQLYVEYGVNGVASNCYAIVTNTKTKYEHRIVFNDGGFVRLGKSSKYANHTVPAVTLCGYEIPSNSIDQGHEFIDAIVMTGCGGIKNFEFSYCTYCGVGYHSYCNIASKFSGNFVGSMSTLCPENEPWTHTMTSVRCGDGLRRTDDAPFWGTWSATWNKNLSSEPIED